MPKIWVASERCYLDYHRLPQLARHHRGHHLGESICDGSGDLKLDADDHQARCDSCGAWVTVENWEGEE